VVDPSVIMKRPATASASRKSLQLDYLTAVFSDPDQERSFGVFIEEESNLPVQRVCRVFMALAFGMVAVGISQWDFVRTCAGILWFSLSWAGSQSPWGSRNGQVVMCTFTLATALLPILAMWLRLSKHQEHLRLELLMLNFATSQITPIVLSTVLCLPFPIVVCLECLKNVAWGVLFYHTIGMSGFAGSHAGVIWLLICMCTNLMVCHGQQIVKRELFQHLQEVQRQEDCDGGEVEVFSNQSLTAVLTKLKHHLDVKTLMFTDDLLNMAYSKWCATWLRKRVGFIGFMLAMIILVPTVVLNQHSKWWPSELANASTGTATFIQDLPVTSGSASLIQNHVSQYCTVLVLLASVQFLLGFQNQERLYNIVSALNWLCGTLFFLSTIYEASRVPTDLTMHPRVVFQFGVFVLYTVMVPIAHGLSFFTAASVQGIASWVVVTLNLARSLGAVPFLASHLLFPPIALSLTFFIYFEIRWQKMHVLVRSKLSNGCEVSRAP